MPDNHRKGRKQSVHLKIARSVLQIMSEENGGALQGRPTKEDAVRAYLAEHPGETNVAKIARECGVSRPTVYKWMKAASS